jgi:hypothetical protein
LNSAQYSCPVLFDPAQDKEIEVLVASARNSKSGVQSGNSILPFPRGVQSSSINNDFF